MKKIAIYGAGGFGKEVACMIKAINEVNTEWDLIGYFDDGYDKGSSNRYGKVLGGMQELNAWEEELNVVFSIASPVILKKLVGQINNKKITFPNLYAPNVLFLDKESLNIGEGNLFFFGCRISCDVTIGNFNLLNSYASLGHDASLGDYNVVGPVVRVSGNTKVGDTNFFGVQSVILQGLKIGDNTKVGANSVIIRNTKNNTLYMGNPAKKVAI